MFELCIKDHICAAHYLRGYEGKCKQLHGHTWKIEIKIVHKELDDMGMVADFTVLKAKLNEFLSILDHNCLNELEYFSKNNPTTENIAKYIFLEYSKMISPFKVKSVEVWESDNASVIYYE